MHHQLISNQYFHQHSQYYVNSSLRPLYTSSTLLCRRNAYTTRLMTLLEPNVTQNAYPHITQTFPHTHTHTHHRNKNTIKYFAVVEFCWREKKRFFVYLYSNLLIASKTPEPIKSLAYLCESFKVIDHRQLHEFNKV